MNSGRISKCRLWGSTKYLESEECPTYTRSVKLQVDERGVKREFKSSRFAAFDIEGTSQNDLEVRVTTMNDICEVACPIALREDSQAEPLKLSERRDLRAWTTDTKHSSV